MCRTLAGNIEIIESQSVYCVNIDTVKYEIFAIFAGTVPPTCTLTVNVGHSSSESFQQRNKKTARIKPALFLPLPRKQKPLKSKGIYSISW